MVRQVQVVAVLMIVHGILELFMGAILLLGAVFAPDIMEAATERHNHDVTNLATFARVVYITLSIPTLLAAILHIAGGVTNLFYRGRVFGILALIFGAGSIASCYCAITSVALLVYGLIVYLHPDVARAFQRVSEGLPPEGGRRRDESEWPPEGDDAPWDEDGR